MAEVKNTFLRSKMNQDLDDRLLPSGEYRSASNVNISRSEGDDVGALENILGNTSSVSWTELGTDLVTIGQFTDHNKNYIYVFLTDWTDPNPFLINYETSAKNFILRIDPQAGAYVVLAQGNWLNFSTTNSIIGVNLIEDLLFWTDNRNQPRKINVSTAVTSSGYYVNEDQISVAKYNPYKIIDFYEISSVPGIYQSTMKDVASEKLPDGITDNPYYNDAYAGDVDYLEDKFVRFSYRFKFDDGEYSIIAPFTQEAYIPKQDGYFIGGALPNSEDEDAAYRSSIVKFMENKVNNIVLNIPLPTVGTDLFDEFKITEIDIIYKESDALAFRTVDTINQAELSATANNVFSYNYQAKKPVKTLPPSETTRVYDKVPVRALSQEVAGNRVIYGNFQDKHTPPTALDYNIGISEKYLFDISGLPTEDSTSIVEYPEHTVKQNRNYQVGVVLSDRYGRQSDVLLSIVNEGSFSPALGDFFASTVYHPYKTDLNDNDWAGDSIKVLFNEVISSIKNTSTGTPGLYNGDPLDSSYEPLGWYSFKVVVKQQEQDYYNVYLPGIINGYPEKHGSAAGFEQDITAFISLHSDNINKVPRDLSEVGPDQKQYRSSVRLFGRVTPEEALTDDFNTPYFPLTEFHSVSAIGEQDTMLAITAGDILSDIYTSESDPLLVRIEQTGNAIGRLPAPQQGSYKILLGVYETNPVVSAIDIYWETSTSGLISDLNDAIIEGTGSVQGIRNFTYTHNEGMPQATVITSDFYPENFQALPLTNTTGVLTQVADLTGNLTRAVDFQLVRTPKNTLTPNGNTYTYDSYVLETATEFYYGSNAGLLESYIFSFLFTDTDTGDSGNAVESGFLTNVAPTIACPVGEINAGTPPHIIPLTIQSFTAVNGTADTNKDTDELVWSIVSQDLPPVGGIGNIFSIDSNTGVLTMNYVDASGLYNVVVKVEDANQGLGSLSDTCAIQAVFGKQPASDSFANGVCNNTGSENLLGKGYVWVDDVTNALDQLSTTGMSSPVPNPNLVNPAPNSWESLDAPSGYAAKSTFLNSNILPTATDPLGGTYTYNPVNEWKNQGYQGNGGTNSGLSAGTAYVTVDFNATQFSFPSSGQNLPSPRRNWIWAALQYRDPNDANYPNNNWVTATDIEGNDCLFGGGQAASESNQFNPGVGCTGTACNGEVSINQGGVKLFGEEAPNDSPLAGYGFEFEMFYTEITEKTSSSSVVVSVTGSKTFAFGLDQRDDPNVGTNTKLGDYRLLLGMPWGDEFGNGTTVYNYYQGSGYPVTPTVLNSHFNNSTSNALSQGGLYNNSRVSWGDFYYPNCTPYTGTSYEYFLDQGSSQQDPNNANLGAISSQTTTLFAREFDIKYVTQFYTDAALTNKYTPPTASFPGTQYFKVSGAKVSNLSNTHVNSVNVKVNGENELSRYWVLGLNSTGLKVEGEAYPSTF